MSMSGIAWAAGLFEGEGYIQHGPGSNGGTRRGLHLQMTDEDVVRRFAHIVGVVGIKRIRRQNRINRENHHVVWSWSCTRWADVERILWAFLPYLGERRREKALALLADPAGPVGRPPQVSDEVIAGIREDWAYGGVSQHDIAFHHGVSQCTVSRVVNQDPGKLLIEKVI